MFTEVERLHYACGVDFSSRVCPNALAVLANCCPVNSGKIPLTQHHPNTETPSAVLSLQWIHI